MAKKKKKDIDFQKVKLKVGRRLKRDTKETRAEFKARKIIIKEVVNFHNDPLSMLSRHSETISHHSKISMLNHFNSVLTSEIVEKLDKPILDSLSKFIIDHSDQVRKSATKCIKTCINQMRQKHLPMKDFMHCLKPYLDCAFSHVSRAITHDCQLLIEWLVGINEPETYETLMAVLLRRHEAGNMPATGLKAAKTLKNYYERNKSRTMVANSLVQNRLAPFVWTSTNFVLDFNKHVHQLFDTPDISDCQNEVTLGQKEKRENVEQKFFLLNLNIH